MELHHPLYSSVDKKEATHEHEKKKNLQPVHLEMQRISPLVHSMKVNIM